VIQQIWEILEERFGAVQAANLVRLFRSMKLNRIEDVKWNSLGEICMKNYNGNEIRALNIVLKYVSAMERLTKQSDVVRGLEFYPESAVKSNFADVAFAAQYATYDPDFLKADETQYQAMLNQALDGIQDEDEKYARSFIVKLNYCAGTACGSLGIQVLIDFIRLDSDNKVAQLRALGETRELFKSKCDVVRHLEIATADGPLKNAIVLAGVMQKLDKYVDLGELNNLVVHKASTWTTAKERPGFVAAKKGMKHAVWIDALSNSTVREGAVATGLLDALAKGNLTERAKKKYLDLLDERDAGKLGLRKLNAVLKSMTSEMEFYAAVKDRKDEKLALLAASSATPPQPQQAARTAQGGGAQQQLNAGQKTSFAQAQGSVGSAKANEKQQQGLAGSRGQLPQPSSERGQDMHHERFNRQQDGDPTQMQFAQLWNGLSANEDSLWTTNSTRQLAAAGISKGRSTARFAHTIWRRLGSTIQSGIVERATAMVCHAAGWECPRTVWSAAGNGIATASRWTAECDCSHASRSAGSSSYRPDGAGFTTI